MYFKEKYLINIKQQFSERHNKNLNIKNSYRKKTLKKIALI